LWVPGKKKEAIKNYQHATELLIPIYKRNPDNNKLRTRLALYNARIGNSNECKTLLNHKPTQAPTEPDAYFRMGLAYELIGERKLALENIRVAIESGFSIKIVEAEPDLESLRRDPEYTLR
jgi:eukaryotic-like serine/threonine-protein kinase